MEARTILRDASGVKRPGAAVSCRDVKERTPRFAIAVEICSLILMRVNDFNFQPYTIALRLLAVVDGLKRQGAFWL